MYKIIVLLFALTVSLSSYADNTLPFSGKVEEIVITQNALAFKLVQGADSKSFSFNRSGNAGFDLIDSVHTLLLYAFDKDLTVSAEESFGHPPTVTLQKEK